MPFKSEKQRRFLWAEHPEIARRWSKTYKTEKNLPMYVKHEENSKNDSKKEARLLCNSTNLGGNKKPHINKPELYAPSNISGTSNANKIKSGAVLSTVCNVPGKALESKISAFRDNVKEHNMDKNTENKESSVLLKKIAAVLSPGILRALEERKALAEARAARYIPNNINLRQYPAAAQNPVIPPPMGLQPPSQPQQTPPQQPSNTPSPNPVGGGSHPSANPINTFGGLSMSGDLNGNAAFGAKNSPDSLKTALAKWAAHPSKPCSCGCGDTVKTCKCSADCKCRKPGGSCYEGEKKAGSKPGLWANIHAKRKRGEKPAKPGDKDYPDSKSWQKTTKESAALLATVLEKIAKSPAWQRSEGKNEEGGLNAKGRASYNKATGGNLKAPVTQKNPKGKAKSRRASFCARMGGMKKKLTGSKTKKDPDSRINKALRKWNC